MSEQPADRTPAPLSEAQLEIMSVIWERGEATVSEVRDVLAQSRDVARNTVQTQIVRLERKGWLEHDERDGTFVYRATRARRSTLAGMVGSLVDRAFGGSADALVHALLHGRGVSDEEAARIRALIDAHADDPAAKRGGER